MRNTIVNLIHQAAKRDKNIYFLTGDLGYSVIDDFMRELPDRCLNMGIAEQNMMGAAAGLALEGKKVFVYSIVPFATLRCLEQIKVDVALQNLDVTIIGVGSGFAYGTLGPTHYSLEDLAVMRAIPRLKVVAPSDPVSAKVLGEQLIKLGGPTYIRLNRGGEPVLYKLAPDMRFGKGYILKPGKNVSILSNGAITEVVLKAAELLEGYGISAEVVDMATVKPIDVDLIKSRLSSHKLLATVEEHNILGGFGSAVAEAAAAKGSGTRLLRLGVNDAYPEKFGNQDYLRRQFGLSAEGICSKIREAYEQA